MFELTYSSMSYMFSSLLTFFGTPGSLKQSLKVLLKMFQIFHILQKQGVYYFLETAYLIYLAVCIQLSCYQTLALKLLQRVNH